MLKLFILCASLLAFTACNDNNKDELKIGFVAGLTGKYSSLGSDIRDGFMLGFDEINYKINDTKINIIQKDDKQDKQTAKQIANYFIKNDIKLIVGNATSSMTKITLQELKDKNDFLLASVTASASEFSKKNDNFIRIQVSPSVKRFGTLKKYILKNKIKKVFYIYDNNNYDYAKGYFGFFQDILLNTGGEKFVISKTIQDGYKNIIKDLKKSDYDLLLIVANSSDTANLIQHLKLENINKQILISGWANTTDFIEFGGKAIEGVIINCGYNKDSKSKNYLKFVERFNKKYNSDPSVFALQGYEMSQILISNLKKTKDISKLKQQILDKKLYHGLQVDITFDKYGDVNRDYFIMKVQNSKFVKLNID